MIEMGHSDPVHRLCTSLVVLGSTGNGAFCGGADLKEIVDGFNKIGASSKELIEVLKAIKTAGALHADLVIR